MPNRSRYRDRIARRAGFKLAGCVFIIFGFTCVMMQSTVWNRPAVPASEPFYTTLPGVDLSGVPPAKLPALLKDLNKRHCPCECMRTVAGCRNHHGTCSFSVAIAKQAVAAASKP
jgi:hypothetical protein